MIWIILLIAVIWIACAIAFYAWMVKELEKS